MTAGESLPITPDELDNILVRQKDKLIELIDNGHIKEAQLALSILTELWTAASYSYKITELKHRIRNRIL